MLKNIPFSSIFLIISGFVLIGMGIYFSFFRPSLLPEDLRYMHVDWTNNNIFKGVQSNWLHQIFWVLGSYIFSTGLLTFYIALTSFSKRLPGSFIIIAITSICSISSMTYINFLINSDFKWILVVFNCPWIVALILYRLKK